MGTEGGAQAAAALLRLGKLWRRSEETLIIEVEEDGAGGEARPAVQPGAAAAEEEAGARPVVEADLAILDCDSDDEVRLPGSLPPLWAPGSAAGLRLMRARAQQCVVCMEDKEHTFVPPHREESGHHVVGHRFCTDCWAEFLCHNLRQQRRGQALMPLACPLCRGVIEVPDVWGVDIELPASWRQPSGAEDAAPGVAAVCPAGMAAPATEPSSLWADVAHGAMTNAAAAAGATECSPLQGGTARAGLDSPTVASRWRALRCPVTAWQNGCFRRLCDALAGATLVQDVSLRDGLTSL